jgi:hypothetical protein
MPEITITLDVSYAQELASTARTTVRKIDLALENKSLKPGIEHDLDNRAQTLAKAATIIEIALHERALANVGNK